MPAGQYIRGASSRGLGLVAAWSVALPLAYSRVRWFRFISLLFGASRWCWIWSIASSVAAVSVILNFGPRLVLDLVAPRGVGFSFSRFPSVWVV